ncbi:MAG TPA: SOS response-associated peptidase [Chitinophagales bacterium]|nr:SOS response-associated peptidase [Chitinophagales bacterium]
MCYHFADADTQEYIDWYVKKNGLKVYIWQGAKYYVNGFDHGKNIVACQGKDHLSELEWGLVPHWAADSAKAKDIRVKTLNAKAETIFELPSFRKAIIRQKCLIFAKGFFEWRHIDTKTKIPYLIGVRDDSTGDTFRPFTFGGIYDTWVDKDSGELKETFSIITVPANEMMEVIHNSKKRMPLIISETDHFAWLNTEFPDRIKQLMAPYPSKFMIAHPISKRITQRGVDKNCPEILQGEEYPQVEFSEFL